MNHRVEIYEKAVRWSEEDGEYAATAVKFPGLIALDPDRNKALEALDVAISLALEILDDEGDSAP